MKRLLAILLAIMILVPATASASNSNRLKWNKRFITLEEEELMDANYALQQVIFKKFADVDGVTVPSGTYIIGEDIPEGTYRIEFENIPDTIVGFICASDSEDDVSFFINESASTSIGKIELKEGMTLIVSNVTAVFYTYTGLFH